MGARISHLEGLLERALDHVLARHGVRRRHWQVLCALRSGALTRARITEALLPFWIAASVTQADVVDDLVRRGWASFDGEHYALTPDGEAAQAEVGAAVGALHAVLAEGFSAAELAALLDGLGRMAANLERELGAGRPSDQRRQG